MLTNYFRTDGWVKSTLGPAVPGAQIYVCTQPANIAALPPSPLATIFSDVNGLVPITQPIITDGFGHYDFYAAAGVYTIVVGLGGVVQQVYTDQSVGGASGTSGAGGGTALVLQVNGTTTTNQLLLNLAGQGSVVTADAGGGTINITGPVFQTSGATNTLQTKLNLTPGTGISLASDGLGGVTITNTLPATAAVPAGTNIIALPGLNTTFATQSTVNSTGATKSFVQYVPALSLLALPAKWTVSILTISASTVVTMQLVTCAPGSLTVLTTTNITFSGSATPTLAPAGIYTSDSISLQLSTANDYYFILNSSTGLIGVVSSVGAGGINSYVETSNFISTTPLAFSGGTLEASKGLTVSWVAA